MTNTTPAFTLTILPDEARGYIYLLNADPTVPKHIVEGAQMELTRLAAKHGGSVVVFRDVQVQLARGAGWWSRLKAWTVRRILQGRLNSRAREAKEAKP
jgi:hypothetical protein